MDHCDFIAHSTITMQKYARRIRWYESQQCLIDVRTTLGAQCIFHAPIYKHKSAGKILWLYQQVIVESQDFKWHFCIGKSINHFKLMSPWTAKRKF